MYGVHVIEQPARKWNLLLTASILVGALLLRVGAPLEAVVGGIGLAVLWNWKGPRIQPPWGGHGGT